MTQSVAAAPRLDRGPAREAWLSSQPAPLYRLEPGRMWTFFRKQPASFWFVCLYIFFEYVRPQAIYAPLKGMPLASISVLLCGAALLLEGRRPHRPTFVDGLLVFFTLVILASSAVGFLPADSFAEFLPLYFGWIIAYVLITTTVDNDRKFVIFMVLYFLWSFKMSQHGTRSFVERGFSFASYGVTCAPQFFNNSGECGIQMAMFFASALYFFLGVKAFLSRRIKWIVALLPVTAALTIMGSSSRGAQMALAAILLWMVLRSKRPFRALVMTAVAAVALYSVLPEEQKDRFRTMGTDDTSMTRRQYWADGIEIMNDNPVLGIGFGNWMEYYLSTYNAEGQLPHNIFVEAGAELGYTGLAGFVMLIIGTSVMNYRTRKMASRMPRGSFFWHMAHGLDGALIGFLVGGFFVTVLYYPFFWMNLSMTAALYNVTRRAWKAEQDTKRALQQTAPAPTRSAAGHAP
jgi:putative inorganic carbon (HCO3(-)) transporter